MKRFMRNAVPIAILGASVWLAGLADAAMRSGMQCPIGSSTPVRGGNSAPHAYSRAARRDRLQEWRKRRQEWREQRRAERRWSARHRLALRPEPPAPQIYGHPAWGDESPSLQDMPDLERPQLPQGLDFQQPPELTPQPFPERFPAPPSFPDYPGFALPGPPGGYLYGYPPPRAYRYVPRRWVAGTYPAKAPASVDPAQAVKQVHAQGPGYGEPQPEAGIPSLKGEASHQWQRPVRL